MDETNGYWRKIHEWERQREEAIKRRKEHPYDPKSMDCSKMPLGCVLWIAAVVVVLAFLILKIVSRLADVG